jgi:hypothetical protein
LTKAVRPPMGLPDPGLISAEVTPPAQRVLEPEIGGVDPVDRAQSGPVGIGHLVRVVSRPALTVLMHAEVAVGFDEAGQDPASAGVDDLGVGGQVRSLDGAGDELGDAAVPDDERARFDRLGTVPVRIGHRHDPCVGDHEICGCGDRNRTVHCAPSEVVGDDDWLRRRVYAT